MTVATTLQIRSKGTLTLPIELRRKYGLEEGEFVTLIDLEDGSFLLTPGMTKVDRFGDRVAKALADEGVSVDDILNALDEERESFYRERYVQG